MILSAIFLKSGPYKMSIKVSIILLSSEELNVAYLSFATSKERESGLLCKSSSGFPHEAVWDKTMS